jgi:hypothetical protein
MAAQSPLQSHPQQSVEFECRLGHQSRQYLSLRMENLCELDLPDMTLFNPIPTTVIKPVVKIRKVEFSQDEK